jgi:hypothetical protein
VINCPADVVSLVELPKLVRNNPNPMMNVNSAFINVW